jgi:hypothetical protein
MTTLDWIGKSAVANNHREVPYQPLGSDGELSVEGREQRIADGFNG